ncbi:rust resistance kinase Lr10 isoform X2 [Manihot esculenta]|uniref:rust resistance kinase Lr10 isoform X2 n=1 Tax=Manihot esculenta TaxID=3983 RepID=UPI000B5D645D|nr:rust resistance kinase Lr10 isoform X2 [Manihot esculenta]
MLDELQEHVESIDIANGKFSNFHEILLFSRNAIRLMFQRSLLFGGQIAFILLLLLQICHAKNDPCAPSSCGNILNISYPFRLQTDPKHCGDRRYSLSCEKNSTVLHLFPGKFYYVQAINYNNYTIRLLDPGVVKDDCSSMPRFPLTRPNFPDGGPYIPNKYLSTSSLTTFSAEIIFMNCVQPINSPDYIDATSCITNGSKHYYVRIDTFGGISGMDWMSTCTIVTAAFVPAERNYTSMSFVEVHRELAYGFEISWLNLYCERCESNQCFFNETENRIRCFEEFPDYFKEVCYLSSSLFRHVVECSFYNASSTFGLSNKIKRSLPAVLAYVGLSFATKTLCGTPFVIAFLVYKWRKRHISGYYTIEEFLQSQNNMAPIRYSYLSIRRITGGFKEKLGEGGFGCVYKGKLRSGRIAAVKMLVKSKTDGQYFINEVATLGRIHHTNVVQLIGFCAEGSKYALVYDFMHNGSLDKYLSSREGSISLSWDKLYEISLGVARGIAYLHQGCDMQILHFDIKPHNILLDESFTPKISDFGLSKLYGTNESIKTLTAARGTIGYMAPELFYRNIGRVSQKADVYSFGMLLLEMAGKRKNLNTLLENSSETYFPLWVYDEASSGNVVEINDAIEEPNKIAKMMVVVGLWCIQMKPSDRPPMNKVIEMLEGDLESLQLPSRFALFPEETIIRDGDESSSMSTDFSETLSLIENAS